MSDDSRAGWITRIEKVRRSRAYVVYVDDEPAFEADDELIVSFGLRVGNRLDSAMIGQARIRTEERRARSHALRLLAIRPRTKHEMCHRLQGRGFDIACAESTVDWLVSLGYLDDRTFARNWVESRSTSKPAGRHRIAFELQQKGIEREALDEALEMLGPDEEQRLAREAAASRLRRVTDDDPDRRRRRLESHLYRRGFKPETIRRVLGEMLADGCESERDP